MRRLEACLQTEVQKLDGLPTESAPERLPFNLSRPGACRAGPPQRPGCTPALSAVALSSVTSPRKIFSPAGAGTLALAIPRPGCRLAPPSTGARWAAGVCRPPGAGRRGGVGTGAVQTGKKPALHTEASRESKLQPAAPRKAVTHAPSTEQLGRRPQVWPRDQRRIASSLMTEEASAGTQKGRNPARERGEGRLGDEGVCPAPLRRKQGGTRSGNC